ncbi:MAG: hypothetical protein EBY16_05480, partial [Gammaproteobacteria bacterium]|nr:hypothetical protein [Gammaproteobacteria bacterium]
MPLSDLIILPRAFDRPSVIVKDRSQLLQAVYDEVPYEGKDIQIGTIKGSIPPNEGAKIDKFNKQVKKICSKIIAICRENKLSESLIDN